MRDEEKKKKEKGRKPAEPVLFIKEATFLWSKPSSLAFELTNHRFGITWHSVFRHSLVYLDGIKAFIGWTSTFISTLLILHFNQSTSFKCHPIDKSLAFYSSIFVYAVYNN